ncbi:hypothetical protein Tco_0389780, partial [Tanacetum coccineum]
VPSSSLDECRSSKLSSGIWTPAALSIWPEIALSSPISSISSWLTAMASEHSSSGPALHEMTPATISSGLVLNPHPSTPFVPPSRTNWDMLFQLLFNEFLNPSPSVDHPAPEVVAPINEQCKKNLMSSNDLSMELVPGSGPMLWDCLKLITSENIGRLGGIYEEQARLVAVVDIPFLLHMTWCIPNGCEMRSDGNLREKAPRAWYDMLSSFLISQDFSKGSMDPTLFIRRDGKFSMSQRHLLLTIQICPWFFKEYGLWTIVDLVDTPMVEKSNSDEDNEGESHRYVNTIVARLPKKHLNALLHLAAHVGCQYNRSALLVVCTFGD